MFLVGACMRHACLVGRFANWLFARVVSETASINLPVTPLTGLFCYVSDILPNHTRKNTVVEMKKRV